MGQLNYRYLSNLLLDVFDSYCMYFISELKQIMTNVLWSYLFHVQDYKTNWCKRSIRFAGVELWIGI